jgi:putative PEP-CTERM system TPR-repeat lipoprotein
MHSVFRTCVYLLVLLAPIALVGCDFLDNQSPEERMQRAKGFEEQGKLKSAMIELKEAARKFPEDGSIRLQLGMLYVELGDGIAAEQEFLRAKGRGVSDRNIMVPMANALLLQGKLKEALASLSNLSGLSGNESAELHLLRGRTYLGLGDLPRAEQEFDTVLTILPESLLAWQGQAILSLYKGRWDEATRWVDKALASDPKVARDWWALKGEIELARGDYKSAEEAYGRAFHLGPDIPPFRTGLAIALLGQGKAEEAKGHLDAVLGLTPQNGRVVYYRAVVDYELKNYASARTRAEKILHDFPEDARSLLLAAAACYLLGEPEAAGAHIGRYLAAVPRSEVGHKLQAAIQLRAGQLLEASKSLERVSVRSEEDARLVRAVGVAVIRQGHADTGTRFLHRVVDKYPNDPLSRIRLGMARAEFGDYQGGVDELERAIAISPKLLAGEFALGVTHLRQGDSKKALEIAASLQQKHPKTPFGFVLEGMAHVKEKRYPEAKAAFTKALEVAPGDPIASHGLATLAILDRDTDQARRLLENAIAKHPKNVQAFRMLTELDLRTGQIQKAEERLKTALDNDRDYHALRLVLGQVYLLQRKWELALKLAQEVSSKATNVAGLHYLEGIAQLQMGRPNLAVVSLSKVTKLAPGVAAGYFQLALAYEQLGNLDRAMQALGAGMKLNPDYVPGKFTRARLLVKNGKPDVAQAILSKLSVTYPNDPEIEVVRGDLAMARGLPKEAVARYKSALSKAETNFILVRVALAEIAAGNRAEAFRALNLWIARFPNDRYTLLVLADALLAAGEFAKASAHYQTVLKQEPKNFIVLNNLAWTSLQAGDPDSAAGYVTRAVELSPSNPEILHTYALILLRQGRAEEAVRKMTEARNRAPRSPSIRLGLAKAYMANKQADMARTILKELVGQGSDSVWKREAADLLKELK